MARYEWNSKYILKKDNLNLAVDLSDMKAYLKVDTTVDDTLITGLIRSATSIVEQYIRRELLTKTFNMYLDFFPYYKIYGNRIEENFNQNNTIEVKRSKLQSITSIKYYSDSVLETLSSSLYSFTQDNDYSRVFLINTSSEWPGIDTRHQAVNIEFIAGYGVVNSFIPEELKTGIKIIVAYLYENRGDCAQTSNSSEIVIISGASVILNQYVILEI